ncbi:MAG: TIGR02757 family protein [Bacteroidetes bacterium]|nr:TIGR02757 family protein [Bacteroidota bacterium]
MNQKNAHALKLFLDAKVIEYNTKKFIERDPISVPHRFSKKQDIEIAALFAAVFAWGNRTTIINKSNELMALMDDAPYEFIVHHQEADLKRFLHFKHRTFNATDLYYFISFLQFHYSQHKSLEEAFFLTGTSSMRESLIHFRNYFFSLEHAERTQKHISTPAKNSACKRINMFLRWMVRKDENGVDFGVWNKFTPSQLICPMDVHVSNVASRLGLIPENIANWKSAELLTKKLLEFDSEDPVKYDFALFGLGAEERMR